MFAGSWTVEAAEAVIADADLDPGDVLDIVASLVEKSLVQFDDGTGRYRLLETVRLYALERLTPGEASGARLRHLDHYLGVAEQRGAGAAAQQKWLASIAPEHENVLAAHDFCRRHGGESIRDLRLAAAMFPYWFHRGLLGVGYRVTLEALHDDACEGPSEARYRALFAAGLMGRSLGLHDEARASIEESLSVARALHDDRRIGLSLSLGRNAYGLFSLEGY